jgi:cystathionine beta-lyase/cystathionine gamma-synthase
MAMNQRRQFKPTVSPARHIGMGLPLRVRDDLRDCALADLADDLDELHQLAQSRLQRLRSARCELEKARRGFLPRTFRTELAQLRSAEETFTSYERALSDWLYDMSRGAVPVDHLRRVKSEYADLLRLQQGVTAALIAGSDWQSPVIEGAGYPTAGRHSGEVTEHLDDYKRDRHPGARSLEESYLREYVDVPAGLEVRALMTTCGMSAFTTILHYLCTTLDQTRAVVASRGMYHECRALLADSRLGEQVHWVDDTDTAEIIGACRRLRPAALFLDSICNSKGLAVADSQAILLDLAASARRNLQLVLDNTCASVFGQPLHLAALNSHVRLLMFDSLTKYAQFGFDRVAAGMIVAPEREAGELDGLREHLGTNVADVCAASIPQPNRSLLSRRLRRIERNARLLAEHLADQADSPTVPGIEVDYPGLPSHECHSAARRLGFNGGFFALSLGRENNSIDAQGRLVSGLICAARRRKVNLVTGASFGLNVTRVYRTATEIGLGPFVRVAAGTEDRIEVERLKEVFSAAISELSALSGGFDE